MLVNSSPLSFRAYQAKDYHDLKFLMEQAYADLKNPALSESEMLLLHEIYPEGQILCFDGPTLVAASMNRIVPTNKYVENFTEEEAANLAVYKLDAKTLESVYAIDFVVLPQYQAKGVAMQLRLALHHQIFNIDNFQALVGVSRICNYYKYQDVMDCETYIAKVKTKEIFDPVLNFHFAHNMKTRAILPNFNKDDIKSCAFGVSVILVNENYKPYLTTYKKGFVKLSSNVYVNNSVFHF